MSAKSELKHSIIMMLKNSHEGSYNTRAVRKKRLLMVADQLSEGGYKIAHIKQLKLKHVQYLVGNWLQAGLTPGTIKTRMTDLRWVMEKNGKSSLIPQKNEDLNIPNRQYVTNEDKSVVLSDGDLSKILDSDVRMSLLLQCAFGLRREESIKIRINEALVGDELKLRGSWCKHGRARSIKIHYPEQWEVIKQVKKYLGGSKRALIPADRTYIQQQNIYDRQTTRAGLHKLHGLRHAYAQKRYFDLTGFPCPAQGGCVDKILTQEDKCIDKLARETISHELGHDRVDVVSVYCGQLIS